jgi:4-hydroxybenzoate polyprenyltransferase
MNPETRKPSRLLAYLQLFRLPNVFTAMADIAMGFWFTHATVSGADWIVFALLLIASSCLYTAGMVLNDVYDLEIDRRERPQRPLPSGRIDARFAKVLGLSLLIAGIVFASAVSALQKSQSDIPAIIGVRAHSTALALAALILLYNRVLKHTTWARSCPQSSAIRNGTCCGSSSPELSSGDLDVLSHNHCLRMCRPR